MKKNHTDMTPQEFASFEIERLALFQRLIQESLAKNPEIDEIRCQEIMEVVVRAFDSEAEYAQDEPEQYMEFYYKT